MALDDKTILNNKLSPLIEGQVPDFVQSDHPVFVEFLKDYYKFLEAGELEISTTIGYIGLETNSTSYVIDEVDNDRIVTEIGAGSTGFFVENEIITGVTSGATATVLVDDSRNSKLFITSQQKFITGEKITGGTSNSEGIVVRYRANPVQNVQQMLDYADVDNTIYDFLDKMRDSFMVDIPDDLASGVSRRDLLKNIKDLYAAKGSSEGHKLFMRMILGESADIFYPNQYMLKASNGNWGKKTIIRALAFPNVNSQDILNQEITGLTSGATATVVSTLISQQTKENFNDSVTELEIANIDGTFEDGEIISGISTVNDREIKFTIFGILSDIDISFGGSLYSEGEDVSLEAVGNNLGKISIDQVTKGRITNVIIDNGGTDYQVNDIVTFTSNSTDTDALPATGIVATTGGGILQETGTLDNSSKTDECIVYEGSSVFVENSFNIMLEETREDSFVTDGASTAYTLTNTNADNDTLVVYLNGKPYTSTAMGQTRDSIQTRWTASGTTITFTNVLRSGIEVKIYVSNSDYLILDRTGVGSGVTGSGTTAIGGEDSNNRIKTNTTVTQKEVLDFSSRNKIIFEYDTFENLGVTSERGSIQHVRINRKNKENYGYSKLPTLSITSTNGADAKILANSTQIGGVRSVKINNSGFRYTSSNPPDVSFRSHFIVKNVSGTFATNNTLTSHTGTVKSWDSNTNELVIENFDDTLKLVQEQAGTFNEGIQLEQATELLTPAGFLLETEKTIPATGFTRKFLDTTAHSIYEIETITEDRIVLDSTDIIDPYVKETNPFLPNFCFPTGTNLSQRIIIKVTAQYNEDTKSWAFYLDGKKQKNFVMYEGNEYYFDLSHPSLYGLQSGVPIEQLQKSFALSTTPDGTHGLGTRATSNITTTQKFNVGGANDNIRIGAGNFTDDNNFFNSIKDLLPTTKDLFIHPAKNGISLPYLPNTTVDPLFDSKIGTPIQDQFATNENYTADELYSIQQGYTGAYLKIEIPHGVENPNNYYYYSPNFSAIGGKLIVKRKPKTIIGEGLSLSYDATDKNEVNFILEDANQDRIVGSDTTRATDKLIMEDGIDSISLYLTEVELLNGILKQKQLTDAQNLSNFYAASGVSDLQSYINLKAQNYEPTYFMNEEYIPPIGFWGGHISQLLQNGYSPIQSGIKVPPEPKHFITPLPNEITIPGVTVNGKVHPSVKKVLPEPINVLQPFFPKIVFNENGNVLIDNLRDNETEGFLVLDGTDANGSNAGGLIASEEFGNTLILDATDSDGSNARDGFLLDDETGDGNILLDATQSDVDAGSDLILEEMINYSEGITLVDSGGASAEIAAISRARGQSTVASTSTDIGNYSGINNLLGEDLIRLQDSFYYQDYSYEVIVGQSLVTYFDELKRAVHPAGFEPFGKVSIATLVSAAITNTAAGVSDYTGDTKTFSPILASVLETIFSQVLQSRLQVPSTVTADGQVAIGSRDDKIVQETGVLPGDNLILDVSTEFNLVLDGIDSNSTDAGDFIVLDRTDSSSTDAGERIVLLDDQASNIIMEDEVLLLELGSDNIVLDGTDEDSSNAGDSIKINAGIGIDLEDGLAATSIDTFLYEQATVTSTKDITNGTGDGGGRIMAETSFSDAGNADRVLVSEKTIKIENRPLPKFERNLLLYLAETPFGSEPCGITLEAGSGSLLDNIVMDGEIPFTEDAFMELERDTEIDNIILDGTDSNSTDAGDGLILETGFFLKIEDPSLGRESETFNILFEDDGNVKLEGSPFSFPFGFHVSNGSKLLLDTLDNDETILLSDISSLTFAQIRTVDKIEIQGLTADEENWGGGADDDNITMEDFGQILLDQTTDDGNDAGFHLLQETSKRNRFTLEESGTLIFEKLSTLSNVAALTLESDTQSNLHGDIIFENSLQLVESFGIKIEDNPDGIIVFDSTDSVGTGDGSRTLLEDFYDQVGDNKVLLEEHNIFSNEGEIPIANYRLNSTNVITKGNVRSADISVRDTGDIALEDATDDTHGYLIINSTSGSSTNAGENFDLEGATGITY